jgi:hypothetical protein
MKNKLLIVVITFASFIHISKASTLMNYELGEITSGGTNLDGSIFFISTGSDGVFNSSTFSSGATNIVNAEDRLLFATAVVGGNVQGSWTEKYAFTVAPGQSITALFVNGLTSSDVSFTTGAFLGGKSVGLLGGTSYAFGTYRSGSAETVGSNVPDAIAWVLPPDSGGTGTISAYSGTGAYTGQDITANLATISSFNLVPEPSSASLLVLGVAGLVALRARRKS